MSARAFIAALGLFGLGTVSCGSGAITPVQVAQPPPPPPSAAQCAVQGRTCDNGGVCCGAVCCPFGNLCCTPNGIPLCLMPTVDQPNCNAVTPTIGTP